MPQKRLRAGVSLSRLEARETPTVFTVTNSNDSGTGSLRQAVLAANGSAGADSIVFDPVAFAGTKTITLTTGELLVTDAVDIQGTGATRLTVSGNSASRILNTFAPGTFTVVVSGVTLTQAKTFEDGGCVLAQDETLVLRDVVVTGNSTTDDGAGIYFAGPGSLTLERCTVSGNAAGDDGGGIYFINGGSFAILDSTVSGNTAPIDEGGGMYFRGSLTGPGVIRNSTFSGNTANGDGGGLALINFFSAAPVMIENSTFTNNKAAGAGGGIARTSGTGTVVLTSTIVAQNINATAADLAFDAATAVTANNSVIGAADKGNFTLTGAGNQTGTQAAPLDAKLRPLANYGGPTLTHALLTGSPVLDKGANPAGLVNDQRGPGFARNVNGVDVGAFEVQGAPPTAVIQVNDGAAQRSMVTGFKVTFSEAVSFPSGLAAAFQLQRTGPGSPTGLVTLAFGQAGTVVTVTFSDPTFAPTGGSLIDGNFTLTLVAAKIQGAGGSLDGDGNGAGGDDKIVLTHRLFGDADGDTDVDAQDYGAFRGAFGSPSVAFDFDGDGDVDAQDFGQFRQRFGSSV